MERKCFECKETIKIDRNNLHKVIKFENYYYHYDCFIKACNRKSQKNNASPKWGLALKSIDKLQEDTKKILETDITKDDIYKFMLEHYDVRVIPTSIFNKLEDIYHGRWKGVSCCIPPEDLLDMWNRKMDYLTKIKMRNITLGKELDGAQQISYDISVLINKYDSYLKWKEQNKIIEQETAQVHKEILKIVDLDKLSRITQNRQKEDEDDMDALLNELFD